LAPVFVSLIAALVFTFFLTQAIFKFKSFGEVLNKDKKNEYSKYVWLMLMPLIVATWLILMNNARRLNNDLPYYGESVPARIIQIDEGHINNKGKKIYMVTTAYTPLNAPFQTLNIDVDFDIKQKIKEGCAFRALYAPFDPTISKLIIDTSIIAVPRYVKTIEKIVNETKGESVEPEFLKFWVKFRKAALSGNELELKKCFVFPFTVKNGVRDSVLIGEDRVVHVMSIFLDAVREYNSFEINKKDSISSRQILEYFNEPKKYNNLIISSANGFRYFLGMRFIQNGEWKANSAWFFEKEWGKLKK
jgi:hypothetical protein